MSETGSTGQRDPEGRRRKGAFAVGEDTAGRRPAWLIPLLALLALIVLGLLLFLLLRNRDSDSDSSARAAAASATGVPTSTVPADSTAPTNTSTPADAATPAATASATASGGTSGGTAADGQVLAGGRVVVPLAVGAGGGSVDLSQYAGQTATARTVAVQSVPADEGFWAGASATDRVWVQLTGGTGESAVTVKAGDRISFGGGKVVATPAGYAAKVGVDATEGAAQLTAQRAHIEIAKTAVKLIP